jgi:hypothetical protein
VFWIIVFGKCFDAAIHGTQNIWGAVTWWQFAVIPGKDIVVWICIADKAIIGLKIDPPVRGTSAARSARLCSCIAVIRL